MFPAVIDEKKERLWDGLIDGLERYNEILTERATQIQSTEALRQQVCLNGITYHFVFLVWLLKLILKSAGSHLQNSYIYDIMFGEFILPLCILSFFCIPSSFLYHRMQS